MATRSLSKVLVVLAALGLVLGACGDDDGDSPEAAGNDSVDVGEVGDEAPVGGSGDEAPSGPGGSGSGTVSLANGETFEFSLMCVLEPQEAAGQEILFSVTSYDEPVHLDATKFGDDAAVPGMATISLYESDGFNELWGATDVTGSGLLELDGTRITGKGSFYDGADATGELVDGTIDFSC